MKLDFAKYLDTALKLTTLGVAGVPALAFIVSVFFDWGIFRAAGMSFSAAPTSISDHFRTSLVWLPGIIILVAIVGIMSLYVISRTPKESGTENKHAEPLSSSPKLIDRVLILVAILMILLWNFAWFAFGSYKLSIGQWIFWITVSFLFSVWLGKSKALNEKIARHKLLILALTPFVLISTQSLGAAYALEALDRDDPRYVIQVAEGESSSELNVRIVRSYGEWMLVVPKPEPDDFVWIKMDDVRRIEVINDGRFQGVFCWFNERFCTMNEQSGESDHTGNPSNN